jgi:hypothetical protein
MIAAVSVVVVGVAALLPAAVGALSDTVTMQLGIPGVGSPFNDPPDTIHDASLTATDSFLPRTVVVADDGTVDFDVVGFHQIAIYEPGKRPKDIAQVVPGLLVNDPDGRIGIGTPPFLLPPADPDLSFAFTEPGRYLVICNIAPHFFEAKMYGWVIVK